MRYSKTAHAAGSSGFFFDDDPNVPADAVKVSDSDVQTAINLTAGSTYDFDSTGKLTATAPTSSQLAAMQQATVTANMANVMRVFRDAREILLNRLMGIAYSASLTGDTTTVQACETARQGLLGIPQLASVTGATDESSLETALVAGYNAVLTAVPANIVKAFAADYNSFTVLGK